MAAPNDGSVSALTVISVEDDGNAIERSDGTDEVSGGDGTSNGRLLLLGRVGDALAGEEGRATLGRLDDDGRLRITGSLEGSNPEWFMLAQKELAKRDSKDGYRRIERTR